MNSSAIFSSPAPLGFGVGLRREHYAHVLQHLPKVDWFEAISENYLGTARGGAGGRPLRVLEQVRAHYPVALHGVSMSLGSTDPLDKDYLKRLKSLVTRIEPCWVSDHLCWTGVEGENLHDLLPLPYTEEALTHVVERVQQAQDFLGRSLLVENVSSYVSFRHSEMTEWDFLRELTRRSGCGILLDINNIYVSACNHGFDPEGYLAAIPAAAVGQFHLAGHSRREPFLVDTHDAPVTDAVWTLYRHALRRFGRVSTLIEWDDNIPPFEVLEAELAKARSVQESLDEPLVRASRAARSAAVDALAAH